METYSYSISGGFSNGCNIDCLQTTVKNSESISTELLGVKIDSGNCYIVFNSALSAPEIIELDTIVSNHTGLSLPDANPLTVGTIRYRVDGNNSYMEMCMQTSTSTYEWVAIKTNNW